MGNKTSLSLIALQEACALPDGMCWRCSKLQGFYSSPCERCGAINPNLDWDGAVAQQQADDALERKP